jgi:5,10-methenyltetrahydromethanopterin hydrogenase
MDHIRNVPELHTALENLLREHIKVDGPNNQYWLPCSTCNSVFAVRHEVVSGICENCSAPCADVYCGLLVFQHEDNSGCEPKDI